MAKRGSIAELLNEQSNAARTTAERHKPLMVAYDLLDTSPENNYSMPRIEELAESIEMVGLLQPLLVRQKQNGRYSIISGHRRHAALGILIKAGVEKYTEVPCVNLQTNDDAMEHLQLLIANSTARIMTQADKMWQTAELHKTLKQLKSNGIKFKMRTRDYLANLLGISPVQAQRYLTIADKLIAEWRELFELNAIGMMAAYEVSRRSPEAQRAMHDLYMVSGEIILTVASDTGTMPTGTNAEQPEMEEETVLLDNSKITKQKNARESYYEHCLEMDCVYGGKCTNADGLSTFVNNGELTGCAGCCYMCKDKDECKKACKYFFDPETVTESKEECGFAEALERTMRIEPKAAQPATPGIVEQAMQGGIQSGAKAAGEIKQEALLLHVVPDNFQRLTAGAVVCFEEHGSGKKKAYMLEVAP